MKNTLKILFITAVMLACHDKEEEIVEPGDCSIPATVRNKQGLDGCGYVFELTDGTILEPAPLLFCGTPPLPSKEQYPLIDFQFAEGKKVLLEYEVTDMPSACMLGKTVNITCIHEVSVSVQEN
ncbi:MAG TPA: hypothetical protein VIN08_09675 [Ohtaekwangia sp.]|uniref:hypothetical protein n=1 Tax=Ohtaekwangia sp. TaxID=2066019 RepID=UPI002F947D28